MLRQVPIERESRQQKGTGEFSGRELEQNMMLCLLAMTCFPVVGEANCDLDNQQSKQLFEVMTDRLFSAIEDYDALRFIARTL